jgi:signal transduction histidine kinase/CHASE2 domain-containing sensor protein
VLARLLDGLTDAGVRAVGIDLLLSEESADDGLLAAAMVRNRRVVLPAVVEHRPRTGLQETLPVGALAGAAAGIGHANVELDADGIARGVFLREGPERASREHFSLVLLRVAGQSPSVAVPSERAPAAAPVQPPAWQRDERLLIPFVGPPGRFTRVSAAAILRGEVPPAALNGRIALIGATALGLGDAYPTPASALGRPMPGTELIANVMQVAGAGEGILVLPPSFQAAIAAAVTFLVLAAIRVLSPQAALWVVLAVAGGAAIGSLVILRLQAWWAPPMALIVPVLAAYPLWTWRRLETAMRFVDAEIARLDREPEVLPTIARIRERAPVDPVEDRLAVLRVAGERLRSARQFVTETLEALPDGAVVADWSGRVAFGTKRAPQDLGVETGAALVGRDLTELLSVLEPETAVSWERIVEHVLTGQRPASCEARHRDGRDFVVKFAPFRADGMKAAAIIALLSDVTPLTEADRLREEARAAAYLREREAELNRLNEALERKVAERTAELADANRELEAFSYSVAHDLRAPLRHIDGFSALLLKLHGDGLDPEVRRLLDRIRASAHHASALVAALLDLSRIARQTLHKEDVDLSALACEVQDELAAESAGRDVEWRIDAGMKVRGDANLLRVVLSNLLGNAFKYTREVSPARIAFGVSGRADGHTEFFVRDNGTGFDMAYASRLFEPFQRLHGAREFEGTGIGLATVHRILARHGGTIRGEGQPGTGATFYFTLPTEA